jgi:hypothetical protein
LPVAIAPFAPSATRTIFLLPDANLFLHFNKGEHRDLRASGQDATVSERA